MATYVAFDLGGTLEQVNSLRGDPFPTARQYWGDKIPTSHRIGTYESQEMLPASKLGIVCGVARLSSETTFTVDAMDRIEARACWHARMQAEAQIVEMTGTILVLERAIEFLGAHARPQIRNALEDRKMDRLRAYKVLSGEAEPEIRLDENLVHICGQTFTVRLDPIEAPLRDSPNAPS